MACEDMLDVFFKYSAQSKPFEITYPVAVTLNTDMMKSLFVATGRVDMLFGPPWPAPQNLRGRLAAAKVVGSGMKPQNQMKFEVAISPTAEVSWQVLINNKPFLNRPASTFQAECRGSNMLLGSDHGHNFSLLLNTQPAEGSPSTPPVPDVTISYRPLLNFHEYTRSNPAGKLLAGPGRVFTIYEIDKIWNHSGSSYTFQLVNVRVDSGQDPDDSYGWSNSPIAHFIGQDRPLYLSPVSQTIQLAPGQAVSGTNIRFVVNADDVSSQTPNWRRLEYLPQPDPQTEGFQTNIGNITTVASVTASDLPGGL